MDLATVLGAIGSILILVAYSDIYGKTRESALRQLALDCHIAEDSAIIRDADQLLAFSEIRLINVLAELQPIDALTELQTAINLHKEARGIYAAA
jgi:hypothetical protein